MARKKDVEIPEISNLELSFEEDALIIKAGQARFRLSKSDAITLADRGVLEERFAQVRTDDDLADVENPLAVYVQLCRVLRHGLNIDQAAKLLGLDQAKARKFYGQARLKYAKTMQAEDELARLEADDTLPVYTLFQNGDRTKTGIKKIVAADIVEASWRGKSDADIAVALRVDLDDLRFWINKNQDLMSALRRVGHS